MKRSRFALLLLVGAGLQAGACSDDSEALPSEDASADIKVRDGTTAQKDGKTTQQDTGPAADINGADGSSTGGWTPAEMAACKTQIIAAATSSTKEGLFVGGFQEYPTTFDPTSGLIVATFPLQNGPIYGQMINTYLDCKGNLGTGGTYKGSRTGTSLQGTWTMKHLTATFGGTWSGTAKGTNTAEINGTYKVTSGPKTTVKCNNPDGTQFGVTGCYCASPGTFNLVKKDEKATAKNIPFTVTQGTPLLFTSQDNPNTATDESKTAQRYAIIDLAKVCSNQLPLLALCPNVLNTNPMKVTYSAQCKVTLPMTSINPVQAGLCPCLFLEPLVKGSWYVAVGINAKTAAGGLAFDDLTLLSFQTFQY